MAMSVGTRTFPFVGTIVSFAQYKSYPADPALPLVGVLALSLRRLTFSGGMAPKSECPLAAPKIDFDGETGFPCVSMALVVRLEESIVDAIVGVGLGFWRLGRGDVGGDFELMILR
jgi:hypothetical protein